MPLPVAPARGSTGAPTLASQGERIRPIPRIRESEKYDLHGRKYASGWAYSPSDAKDIWCQQWSPPLAPTTIPHLVWGRIDSVRQRLCVSPWPVRPACPLEVHVRTMSGATAPPETDAIPYLPPRYPAPVPGGVTELRLSQNGSPKPIRVLGLACARRKQATQKQATRGLNLVVSSRSAPTRPFQECTIDTPPYGTVLGGPGHSALLGA